LDLARKNDCVVQCGTQHRSNPLLRGVAAEVASGVLGKISRVSTAVSFDGPRWKRAYDNCKEQDVDWDAFLLYLGKRPFDPGLLREWHLRRETSNGLPGLWMVHNVDAMAMMMDAKYPTNAVANGGIYVWKDGREHADTMTALLEYPEGFIFDWAMSLATRADRRTNIYGRKGTLRAMGDGSITADWQLTTKAAKSATTKPRSGDGMESRKVKPVLTAGDHMENWLECIRGRQRPRADIQFGHQHAVASIMTAAALQTGQRHKYDQGTQTIKPG
jgi:predicted dehydrogenase